MSISLNNTKLYVFCIGIGRVYHNVDVTDGQWHTVRWSQSLMDISLIVDDTAPQHGTIPGSFTSLDVDQNGVAYIHIGGFADFEHIRIQGTYVIAA